MRDIELANPPKALIVLVALICVTLLMLVQRIETETGAGLIGLICGYGIGNGIAAKEGKPVKPIFDTTHKDRRADDHAAIADDPDGTELPSEP